MIDCLGMPFFALMRRMVIATGKYRQLRYGLPMFTSAYDGHEFCHLFSKIFLLIFGIRDLLNAPLCRDSKSLLLHSFTLFHSGDLGM